MKLSFVGDWLPKKQRDPLPDADAYIGNLECAFSGGKIDTDKAYTAVLSYECIDNVGTGGFTALSLANNHVNDAGNFVETYAELKCRFPGIQFFGTVERPYVEIEVGGRRVFVVGCLEPCRSRGKMLFRQEDVLSLIQALKSNGKDTDRIVIYPHWGMEGEYTRYPSPRQMRLARSWVEAGADAVIGSHSHIPQGREYYRGKPIFYSLGNFDFDHPESKLYEGTSGRLEVSVGFGNESVEVAERYNSEAVREAVEKTSEALKNWSLWRWAQAVGPFNLRKNMASWKIRLRKNFIKTLPKFLVWQCLPKIVLFRVAGFFSKGD